MPTTRNMKSSQQKIAVTEATTSAATTSTTAAGTLSVAATPSVAATTSSAAVRTSSVAATSSTAATTSTTNTSGDTTTTGATETTEATGTTEETARKKEPKHGTARTVRTTASQKKKALAKAREELLQKEVELAAARVAALEAESEDDEEVEDDDATVRRERTSDWVHRSTLALTMEPHVPEIEEVTSKRQGFVPSRPVEEDSRAPPPQPSSDALHRDHARHVDPHAAMPTIAAAMQSMKKEEPVLKVGIDCNEFAIAMQMAARNILPSTASRVTELPVFNGSSSEWLPWKMAYEESASQHTEQENLARLRRSLKGAAKDAARSLFVGSTTAEEVMKMLAARFGRPGALVTAELNKLRALPRLSDNARDVCLFASKVQNVVATIRALNKSHYLYNEEIVRNVTEKMPSVLRFKYYDFANDQPEGQPDLITLSQFLQRTAARCGNFAPAEEIPSEDRRESAPRKTAKTYTTQEKPATPPCPMCRREGHAPSDCKTMKEADTSARWELAKTHRLCFRCLKVRRFRHACKSKRCGVDECTQTHHPLLHTTRQQPENEVTTHVIEDKSAAVAASARENDKIAFLKILPIRVTGPTGTCDTYALLDDGSTCTIIETAVAERIGATGPPAPFYMEGVAGARINAAQSTRVHFKIHGRNSQEYTVGARTMDRLQLSPQSVPRSVIKGCPHLQDIERELVYEEGKPTVLLGQDNWHLLLAHEVRRGSDTQPFASLTDLGWVLHGTSRGRTRQQVHRISHIVTTHEEEQSMEEMMKQHFALESLGIASKRSYNEEERRALHILEEKTRPLPAGRYETGLLWKKDDPVPPDNYESAMRRLQLVERKFDKNEEQWPREDSTSDDSQAETGEERVHKLQNATQLSIALPDPSRFSNWLKLVRSSARVLQFIDLLRPTSQRCTAIRKRNKKKESADPTWTRTKKVDREKTKMKIKNSNSPSVCFIPIDTHYLDRARRLWIRAIQQEAFGDEIAALKHGKQLPSSSRLIQLSVVIDNDDILRLRSRIAAAADLSAEQREPPSSTETTPGCAYTSHGCIGNFTTAASRSPRTRCDNTCGCCAYDTPSAVN
ncbi:uncharacterized protein LOC128201835 [Galleria mellonella]|uniref:Uncharacterized protein LOC128201835 n=1 Tax=Galleria mellonella TaxID=7137 RepID=A0ABM3MX69_GALME|nr:uncharacterized protein LOC128201835 [Galleria mellonella]XP_052755945.1 uncharacterized protein LOC128201835 [Galleria mellonella]XP_052755946.1 uncharacterized protein LOC128201835 [Galleria mellonella]